MARSTADLTAIKNELANNPNAYPDYLPHDPANDAANSEALNLKRASINIERTAIPTREVVQAIDRTELAATLPSDQSWLDLVTKADLLDASTGTEIREGFLAIFGAGTATRANLQALLTVPGNRIEDMFQAGLLEVGGTVTPSDVANARNA